VHRENMNQGADHQQINKRDVGHMPGR
jgi:hypothetical protein